PEAKSTYAFLLYSQALNDEDEAALLQAAPLMAAAKLPASIWLEGGVWLVSRKSAEAAPYLEQGLAVAPDDMSLNLLYAEALMEQGTPERGVQLMRAFLAKHPGSLDARLELALLLVKSKEYAEAETLLNSVSSKERTPLVDYYHARALIGMDRSAEAIPFLQKAIKEMPDFVEAMAELAFIYEQRSEFKPARTLYEKLLKLNFSPQDVLLRLISLSLRMNQPEKALKYMRQGPDTIPFKLTVAGLFIDSRHYLQGETLLKQIAARDDAPVDVYLLLADLNYEQRRDLPMALSWLDKVPPQSKAAPRAALLRIQLLGEAGKEQEALTVTRQAQKQFEDAPQFWELEIRLLARQQQMPQALEIARKAAKKWPDNVDMAFLLGSLLDESGDKKEAFKVMEHILTLHPENYQALNYVGYTLAEENRDLEKALSLLVKADELSPNQSYIVDSLAWVLYKLGRNEEALKEIRRAVKLDEHVDASIWEHYGDIASKMGLKDEARTAYQKALDLKPANADALRQRLSQL
ncbi:MAG: tetratricopeptide repeat protein, partial [Desulfovibrio sp.]|uniref:tetratricopeptide repeat protein n=1 Tax=Desulfovibrio sp. TaxID=885 RepID=UPI0039E4F8FF